MATAYDEILAATPAAAPRTPYDDILDSVPAAKPSRWGAAKDAAVGVATTPFAQALGNATGMGHVATPVERYDYGMNAPGGVKDLATRAIDTVGGRGTTQQILRDVPALKWIGGAADEGVRAGLGLLDFGSTPAGLALPGASKIMPPAVSAAVGAGFATEMAPGTAEAAREAWRDPNATTVPRAASAAAMNLLPVAHGRGGPRPVTRVSPEKYDVMRVPEPAPKPVVPPAVNVVRSGDPALRRGPAGPPAVSARPLGDEVRVEGMTPPGRAEESAGPLERKARYEDLLQSDEPQTVYPRGGQPYGEGREAPPVNQAERRGSAGVPETGVPEERGPSVQPAEPPPVEPPAAGSERPRPTMWPPPVELKPKPTPVEATPEALAKVQEIEQQPGKATQPSQLPKSAEESAAVFEQGPTKTELFDEATKPKPEPPTMQPTPEARERVQEIEEQMKPPVPEPPKSAAESAGVFEKAGDTYAEMFDKTDKPQVGGEGALVARPEAAVVAPKVSGEQRRAAFKETLDDLTRESGGKVTDAIRDHLLTESPNDWLEEHMAGLGIEEANRPEVRTAFQEYQKFKKLHGEILAQTKNLGNDMRAWPVELRNQFAEFAEARRASQGRYRAAFNKHSKEPATFKRMTSEGATEFENPHFTKAPARPVQQLGIEAPKPLALPEPSLEGFLSGEEGWAQMPSKQDLADAWQKFKTEATEKYTSVSDLAGKARENIPGYPNATRRARLAPDKDPFIAMRNFAGAGGMAEARLRDYGRTLTRAKKSGLLEAAKNYALYERYEELHDRSITQFPNGQTIHQIRRDKAALEATLGPTNVAKVKGFVGEIRAYSDKLLTYAKDGGIISDAAYQAILKKNQKYVPLQRLAYLEKQIAENAGFDPKSFSVGSQELIKTIQGSQKEIVDPLEAIIRNTQRTVSLVERNKAATMVADLSKRPEYAGVVDPIKPGHAVPAGMERISILRDGVREDYVVPADVGRAMKNMDAKQVDLVTKMAKFTGGLLRAGATTLNAPFMVSNAVRDYQTATAVSRVGFTPAMWARGFAAAVSKGKLYEEYLASGASMSGYFEGARSVKGSVDRLTESTGKKVARAMLPWNMVRNLGELTELAPRLGVFDKSQKLGVSTAEAAFNTRSATVDFSRSGNAMRVINMWVPFLNARLQGNIALFQSMNPGNRYAVSNSRQLFGKQRSAGQVATWNAVKLGTMATIPAVATYLYNHRDAQTKQVWDSISDYEKRANFIIVFGTAKDDNGFYTQVVKVPKGDVKAFVNPIENFLDYMEGNDPKSLGQLAVEVGSDVSPVDFERNGKLDLGQIGASVTPPTLKGALEGVNNKNMYTGREIVPEYYHGAELQKASPQKQYTDRTSKLAIGASKVLGGSPMKWENFAGTQFGGLGRQAMSAAGSQKNPDGASSVGETIKRRFVGAHEDIQGRDMLANVERERADKMSDVARDAEGITDKLAAMKNDQERGTFVRAEIAAGRMSEALQDAVQSSIEGRAQGLTPIERSLKHKPLEVRAEFIARQLNAAKTNAEKGEIARRYEEKGIITEAVGDMIGAILDRTPPPGTGPPPVRVR